MAGECRLLEDGLAPRALIAGLTSALLHPIDPRPAHAIFRRDVLRREAFIAAQQDALP